MMAFAAPQLMATIFCLLIYYHAYVIIDKRFFNYAQRTAGESEKSLSVT